MSMTEKKLCIITCYMMKTDYWQSALRYWLVDIGRNPSTRGRITPTLDWPVSQSRLPVICLRHVMGDNELFCSQALTAAEDWSTWRGHAVAAEAAAVDDGGSRDGNIIQCLLRLSCQDKACQLITVSL